MRIAIFVKATTFNKTFGGLETQNKLLSEGLAEEGHGVCVFSPRPCELRKVPSLRSQKGRDFPSLCAHGVSYYFLTAPAGRYSKDWWKESVRVFRFLHKEEPFDVVISQSMAGQGVIRNLKRFDSFKTAEETFVKENLQGLGFSTLKVKELAEPIPVVVIQHGTILGELETRWKSLPALGEIRRFSKIRSVAELTRFVKEYLFFFFRLIPYGLKIYLQDQLRLRRADKVIPVSDQVKKTLIREYFLSGERITVVHNGIEIEQFGARNLKLEACAELEIEKKDRVILYIGRIEKEKGLSVLLHALSQLADFGSTVSALIVGSGPYLVELKAEAEELGISERIIFSGKVSYEDVSKYYAAADIFVLPSLRQEGLPMTLPEAMASELPVIASDIGGISEAVKDGKTGILVEPWNVSELSLALEKLLDNASLRKQMGKEAVQLAEDKFSQKSMVKQTLDVIREAGGKLI